MLTKESLPKFRLLEGEGEPTGGGSTKGNEELFEVETAEGKKQVTLSELKKDYAQRTKEHMLETDYRKKTGEFNRRVDDEVRKRLDDELVDLSAEYEERIAQLQQMVEEKQAAMTAAGEQQSLYADDPAFKQLRTELNELKTQLKQKEEEARKNEEIQEYGKWLEQSFTKLKAEYPHMNESEVVVLLQTKGKPSPSTRDQEIEAFAKESHERFLQRHKELSEAEEKEKTKPPTILGTGGLPPAGGKIPKGMKEIEKATLEMVKAAQKAEKGE